MTKALVYGAVPARVLLDLAWCVDLPGGFTLGQVGGALLVVALTAGALLERDRWDRRLQGPFAALGSLVVLGALRAPSALSGLAGALHLFAPVPLVLLCAAAGEPRERVGRVWRAVAWVPVGASLVALAAGQRDEVVLNGWPRLIGAYGNVHTHAMAMAVFACSAAFAYRAERRGSDAALAVCAGVACALSLVRSAFVFALVALGAGFAGSGVLLAGVGLGAAMGVWVVADRWSDVTAVLTGDAPPGGWGALGSWRGRIWVESVRTWARGPWSEVLLGRGIGGQFGLHRHLDPHHEGLSLLFQFGPAGPVVWGWAAAIAGWWTRWDPGARGLVLATIAVALVGNDVLFRPTLAWWVCGTVGLSLGAARGAGPPGGPEPRAASTPA